MRQPARALCSTALIVVVSTSLSATLAARSPAASRAAEPLSAAPAESAHRSPTSADVLAASTAADWRPLDPQNTLYVELPAGRVVIELAPQFAPHHVANIEALAREKYYDGTAI